MVVTTATPTPPVVVGRVGVSLASSALAQCLLLPGWRNSGEGHWQSLWEAAGRGVRVVQDDWEWPRRGDWLACLEEAILALPTHQGAVLVAHSLGCQLVAAWAAHSRHSARVRAALLVAPPDTERDDMPPQLYTWRPMVRSRLPFASMTVLSTDDPYCTLARGTQLAQDWGSAIAMIGACGHINAEAGLGAWPQGQALLQALWPELPAHHSSTS